MLSCEYCGRETDELDEVGLNAHASCCRERQRRLDGNLCVFCGDPLRPNSGVQWHDALRGENDCRMYTGYLDL